LLVRLDYFAFPFPVSRFPSRPFPHLATLRPLCKQVANTEYFAHLRPSFLSLVIPIAATPHILSLIFAILDYLPTRYLHARAHEILLHAAFLHHDHDHDHDHPCQCPCPVLRGNCADSSFHLYLNRPASRWTICEQYGTRSRASVNRQHGSSLPNRRMGTRSRMPNIHQFLSCDTRRLWYTESYDAF
jgi:hypothetical protein